MSKKKYISLDGREFENEKEGKLHEAILDLYWKSSDIEAELVNKQAWLAFKEAFEKCHNIVYRRTQND